MPNPAPVVPEDTTRVVTGDETETQLAVQRKVVSAGAAGSRRKHCSRPLIADIRGPNEEPRRRGKSTAIDACNRLSEQDLRAGGTQHFALY